MGHENENLEVVATLAVEISQLRQLIHAKEAELRTLIEGPAVRDRFLEILASRSDDFTLAELRCRLIEVIGDSADVDHVAADQ